MAKLIKKFDKFNDFLVSYVRDSIEANFKSALAMGVKLQGIEVRDTKSAECFMITFQWLIPVSYSEKERNRLVLSTTSRIVAHSGDLKLFWHKPNDVVQQIDVTALVWY